MQKTFKNEPFTDFSDAKNVKKMTEALAKVRANLNQEYPLIILGDKVKAQSTFPSLNPANTKEIVGVFQDADETLTHQAIEAAAITFETWKETQPKDRAQMLFKLAHLMQNKKFELASWLVIEAGKSWPEADGETAEAIDFCNYYAHEMIRLSEPPQLTKVKFEKNELVYLPLGVGAIISPWNFPLAIFAGMTVSAVVTGNTVVAKPSEYAPTLGYQFMRFVKEAGIPPGVINFVTSQGSKIGEIMVKHPKVRFISFTGSKKVGLEINAEASKIQPGQKWIKRVIAEMGGKDAIIVDRDANLEDAATNVLAAAFGLQGQKCSACSRAIIDESIYDEFQKKLLEKTKQIQMGDPSDPKTFVGPVISEAAIQKAKKYIEIGKKEGRLLTGGNFHLEKGYFLEPTVFGDVSPKATIAQEEIFAPVLALIQAKDFNDALNIANDTEYGLTGSVYTNNASHKEMAKKKFHVGNFYINRKCTGALVGVHPFGGFNLSGTNSKAGGPDYLKLFMQAKTISERSS